VSHLSAKRDSIFFDIFLVKTEIGVMMFGNDDFAKSQAPEARVRNLRPQPAASYK
jgi:hypothetical protein